MQRYEIKATIESFLDHKAMVKWLEGQGFHTIECTINDD